MCDYDVLIRTCCSCNMEEDVSGLELLNAKCMDCPKCKHADNSFFTPKNIKE